MDFILGRGPKNSIWSEKFHMETEDGLYFGKGSEKFHYVFTFRFQDYFWVKKCRRCNFLGRVSGDGNIC